MNRGATPSPPSLEERAGERRRPFSVLASTQDRAGLPATRRTVQDAVPCLQKRGDATHSKRSAQLGEILAVAERLECVRIPPLSRKMLNEKCKDYRTDPFGTSPISDVRAKSTIADHLEGWLDIVRKFAKASKCKAGTIINGRTLVLDNGRRYPLTRLKSRRVEA